MNQEKLEERLNDLESIKKEWNDKFDKMKKTVEGYAPTNDQKELDDFKESLDSCQNELREVGKKYKETLKDVLSEIEKDTNDPIASQLCKPVIEDIDDNYATYQGCRETRLRDINELIEMYKAKKT